MKTRTLLFFSLLLFSGSLQALDFAQTAPLYAHLCEVNAQWRKHTPDPGLLVPAGFLSDRQRIRKHLELVEQQLRANCPAALSPAQWAKRMHHLDVLRIYRENGVFPTNMYHTVRAPYFRDDYGVLCAVGYLLWQDGQRETVNRIQREDNYGYLFDLARTYPELGAWALENGFTEAELAWIQPAYEPPKPDLQHWGQGAGLNPGGRINTMTRNAAETKMFVAGQFTQIDGFTANSIAVWDGVAWSALGAGVNGEILTLHYFNQNNKEKLFVGGDFSLPGQIEKCNIAEYDLVTKTWKALQTGEMGGKVHTLLTDYFHLYAGGDFQHINGDSLPYFAWYGLSTGLWFKGPERPETDGPVYALCPISNSNILVGGAFQNLFPDHNKAWVASPHLAHYFYGQWTPLETDLSPVRALAFHGGNVYTGHKIEILNSDPQQFEVIPAFNVLQAGLWFPSEAWPSGDSLVHGFAETGGNLIAYGGVNAGIFHYGIGAATFGEQGISPWGVLIADSTVRALLQFRNSLYVAGDFHALWTDSFPGMARIPLIPTPVVEPFDNGVQVIASAGRLTLHCQALAEGTQLAVYDLAGRLMTQQTLPAGDGETTLDATAAWADGLYVWQLRSESGSRAGKWVVAR